MAYYSGASSSDIALAKQIATEGNELLGGLYGRETPHCYCMNNVGKYTEAVPAGEAFDSLEGVTVTEDGSVVTPDGNTVEGIEVTLDTEETHDTTQDTMVNLPDDVIESTDETEETNNLMGDSVEEDTESEVDENNTLTENSVVTVQKQYYAIGRFVDEFIDEDTPLTGYNKPIKDLTATEIIQHTIEKLPISYITGYNEYSGEIFDKKLAASDLGYTYEE